MTHPRPVLRALLCLAALSAATPMAGHVVYERNTLSRFTTDADLIVLGTIEGPERIHQIPETGFRTSFVSLRVERMLKGRAATKRIDFVGYGRGVESYAAGRRAIVFLTGIEKDRRAARRGLGQRFRWLTYQEPGQDFPVEGRAGDLLVEGVERLVALGGLPAAERIGAFREIVISFAGSDARALRLDALNELLALADLEALLRPEDVARLDRTLARPAITVAERVALVAALSQHPGYDAPARLLALLDAAPSEGDRVTVIRALASFQDPRGDERLRGLLRDRSPRIRAEAVAALGRPGNAQDASAMARTAHDPDANVRLAAVKSLGRTGGPLARAALVEIVQGHPDPALRRWAQAQIRMLDARAPSGVDDPAAAPFGPRFAPPPPP